MQAGRVASQARRVARAECGRGGEQCAGQEGRTIVSRVGCVTGRALCTKSVEKGHGRHAVEDAVAVAGGGLSHLLAACKVRCY